MPLLGPETLLGEGLLFGEGDVSGLNPSEAAIELYEALDPAFTAQDPQNDWVCLAVCIAITTGNVDFLHEIVLDHTIDGVDYPGWSILWDVDRCPVVALPYLAQFDGAILRPDMSTQQRRDAIKAPQAFSRGRLKQIEEVAKRRLTGTKTVTITERYTGNAWRVLVETLESETPEPALTEAEIREEAKPIGILLFFNAHPAWTWEEMREEEPTDTWKEVREEFNTWLEVRTHEP